MFWERPKTIIVLVFTSVETKHGSLRVCDFHCCFLVSLLCAVNVCNTLLCRQNNTVWPLLFPFARSDPFLTYMRCPCILPVLFSDTCVLRFLGEGERRSHSARASEQVSASLLSLQMKGCVSAAPAESTALLSPAGSQLLVYCSLVHTHALSLPPPSCAVKRGLKWQNTYTSLMELTPLQSRFHQTY